MKVSVFLTVLIAFCAVQALTQSVTSSPTTPPPGETSSPETPPPGETSSPETPTSGAPSNPETPTSGAPSNPETPTSGAPSNPETPTSGAPSNPETPTSGAPSNPETPTSGNPSSPATPTSNATESLPPTTQEPLPCVIQPCSYGATCINLWKERVCRCPYGFFYGLSGCQPGKIFPGQIQLSVQYKTEMEATNSPAYQELYNNVTQFFNKTLGSYHYEQTIFVNVIPVQSTSTRLRKAETTTEVKFINMFDGSTNLTHNGVAEILKKSEDKMFMNYRSLNQCDVYGCDSDTTNCMEPQDALQFPECTCEQGLSKKNLEDKACLLCDNQCTSENHRQCVHTERGIPSCTCQPDFEFKNEKCEQCSFGYSGKDCSNNFLVILVGVATACGAVIVVLTGVLIYKILRAKKESSSETRSLLNSDSSSLGRVPENNSATNFATNARLFPRIQTRNPTGVNKTVVDNGGGQARYTQEPGVANKAYIPERDYDDDDNPWLEMSARGKF